MSRPKGRKSKPELLDELVKDTDTLYRDDLEKIGVRGNRQVFSGVERRLNVKIVEINYKSWDIIRNKRI